MRPQEESSTLGTLQRQVYHAPLVAPGPFLRPPSLELGDGAPAPGTEQQHRPAIERSHLPQLVPQHLVVQVPPLLAALPREILDLLPLLVPLPNALLRLNLDVELQRLSEALAPGVGALAGADAGGLGEEEEEG